MNPNGREVTFYEEDGTQHFLEALLIAQVVVPSATNGETAEASAPELAGD